VRAELGKIKQWKPRDARGKYHQSDFSNAKSQGELKQPGVSGTKRWGRRGRAANIGCIANEEGEENWKGVPQWGQAGFEQRANPTSKGEGSAWVPYPLERIRITAAQRKTKKKKIYCSK